MFRKGQRRVLVAAVGTVVALSSLAFAGVAAGAGGGKSFAHLQSGFSQEMYGITGNFLGGVAFAKDGDPWVDSCGSGGSSTMYRFDAQTLDTAVHGTSTLHKSSTVTTNVGCGLTNGANGDLYSNTTSGVTRLDPASGALKGGPFGPGGNALGIAPDPVTKDLVYVSGSGTLTEVNEALTTTKTFSTALNGKFIDGIFFDPTGKFLFASDRTGNAVAIIKRDGTLAQSVSVSPHGQPDGIAFHAVSPKFVVTNNTDGTMSRIDFANEDPTKAATVTTFADGGFRGDLGQVGPDGCLYLTQDGQRFDDGTTGEGDSLVRICGNFVTPPGAGTTTTTSTTTTVKVQATTVPTTAAPTTTPPTVAPAAELPRTGSSSGPLGAIGGAAVVAGALLAFAMRRRQRLA